VKTDLSYGAEILPYRPHNLENENKFDVSREQGSREVVTLLNQKTSKTLFVENSVNSMEARSRVTGVATVLVGSSRD
jgi:hypothetical protein